MRDPVLSAEIDEQIDRLQQQISTLRIYLAAAIAMGVLAISCLVIPLWCDFGDWLLFWIPAAFVACGALEMLLLDKIKHRNT
jgi:hypothetical protein